MQEPYILFDKALAVYSETIASLKKQKGALKWINYNDDFLNDTYDKNKEEQTIGIKGIKSIDANTFKKLVLADEIIKKNKKPGAYWFDFFNWLEEHKGLEVLVLSYIYDFYSYQLPNEIYQPQIFQNSLLSYLWAVDRWYNIEKTDRSAFEIRRLQRQFWVAYCEYRFGKSIREFYFTFLKDYQITHNFILYYFAQKRDLSVIRWDLNLILEEQRLRTSAFKELGRTRIIYTFNWSLVANNNLRLFYFDKHSVKPMQMVIYEVDPDVEENIGCGRAHYFGKCIIQNSNRYFSLMRNPSLIKETIHQLENLDLSNYQNDLNSLLDDRIRGLTKGKGFFVDSSNGRQSSKLWQDQLVKDIINAVLSGKEEKSINPLTATSTSFVLDGLINEFSVEIKKDFNQLQQLRKDLLEKIIELSDAEDSKDIEHLTNEVNKVKEKINQNEKSLKGLLFQAIEKEKLEAGVKERLTEIKSYVTQLKSFGIWERLKRSWEKNQGNPDSFDNIDVSVYRTLRKNVPEEKAYQYSVMRFFIRTKIFNPRKAEISSPGRKGQLDYPDLLKDAPIELKDICKAQFNSSHLKEGFLHEHSRTEEVKYGVKFSKTENDELDSVLNYIDENYSSYLDVRMATFEAGFFLLTQEENSISHIYWIPIVTNWKERKAGGTNYINSNRRIGHRDDEQITPETPVPAQLMSILHYMTGLVSYKQIEEIKADADKPSTNAAAISIMSRNISHNLGSHLLSYVKNILSSEGKMLDQGVFEPLLIKEETTGKWKISQKLVDTSGNLDKDLFLAPYLHSIGHLLSYLQERQDYVGAIAATTGYGSTYFTPVNFKETVFDYFLCPLSY